MKRRAEQSSTIDSPPAEGARRREASADPKAWLRALPGAAARILFREWRPRRPFVRAVVTATVLAAFTALLVLHGLSVGDADRWFHEGKPATILCGLLLAGLSALCYRFGRRRIGPPNGKFWGVLAIIFGFAAADEIFKLHEHVEILLQFLLGIERKHGAPLSELDGYLVLIYPLAAGIAGLIYLRHAVRFPPTLRWWIAGAGLFVLMQLLDSYVFILPVPPDGDILWEELAKLGAVICLFAGGVALMSRADVPDPRLDAPRP